MANETFPVSSKPLSNETGRATVRYPIAAETLHQSRRPGESRGLVG